MNTNDMEGNKFLTRNEQLIVVAQNALSNALNELGGITKFDFGETKSPFLQEIYRETAEIRNKIMNLKNKIFEHEWE